MTSTFFDFLYFFQGTDSNYIFEVKRTDLPSSSGPEKIYQWFYLNFNSNSKEQKIIPLTFRKMEENFREFAEGTFTFNAEIGNFNNQKLKNITNAIETKIDPQLLANIHQYVRQHYHCAE